MMCWFTRRRIRRLLRGSPSLQFPDSVCISSQDQYAQQAKMMAEIQLLIVKSYSSLATAFFGPLNDASWQQGSGDCWDYDYGYAGCTVHYNACLSGSDYTYTLTYNGACSGQNYSDWVAWRAVSNADTRTSTFYMYAQNSTTIEAAWIWTWAADENSGTYTFYDGDPATAPVQSSIVWSKSADGNIFDMTYEIPNQTKFVSHFEKDPCSGYLRTFSWDDTGSRWWMQEDIAWNADQTGYWKIYDDSGSITEEHVW